jgi:hypothetical protein
VDLTGANLSGADLTEVDLSGVDFDRAARLDMANLSGARLVRANLTNARLPAAYMFRTDLSEAILDGALLWRAKFIEANLDRTAFSNALIDGTVFAGVDLSTAKSLETITHTGASVIGIDTLYKSRGEIPEAFLRGCGVPDSLIACLPSLMGAQGAIQSYSCFISYSHADEEFAKRLYSRMRDEHLRVWYAPEDIKGGRKILEQIEQAIRNHDKLLLVLSETSMKSEWVATEIYRARQREVCEEKRVLFPIRLVPYEAIKSWTCFDADTGKDMAREIREYFIPDFCNWRDYDSFEAGFKRLLEDLKADRQK